MIQKVLFFLALIVGFIACDGNRKNAAEATGYPDADSKVAEMEAMPNYNEKVMSPPQLESQSVVQKLIKTAYLTFETPSIEKTYQSVKKSVLAHHGYIQNDNTSKSYDRISRSLLIRIPNDDFQPVVDSIVQRVKVLDKKDISSQDVTEEFVDLEARLKAKRKLEERYLQLLSKAKTVKDMLEIERQILQIREEIEAKQGRLKYLQNQVSYSTIHLNFYELIPVENPPSQTYLSRLWRAAKGGFAGIGNFVIGLVYIWPFILIGIIIGLLIRNRIRRRKISKTDVKRK